MIDLKNYNKNSSLSTSGTTQSWRLINGYTASLICSTSKLYVVGYC